MEKVEHNRENIKLKNKSNWNDQKDRRRKNDGDNTSLLKKRRFVN